VKGVGSTQKEFLALLDPKNLPTDTQIEAAVVRQFDTILRRAPTTDEKSRFDGDAVGGERPKRFHQTVVELLRPLAGEERATGSAATATSCGSSTPTG